MRKAWKAEDEDLYNIISNEHFISSFALSDREKNILQMRQLYNQSYSIIGKQFNISREMARVIYKRAIDKLRDNVKVIVNITEEEDAKDNTMNIQQVNNNNNVIVVNKDLNVSVVPIFKIEDFSNKCKSGLKHKSIITIQQLTDFTEKELLGFRGFGKKIVYEIQTELAKRNLKLRDR